MVLAVRAVNNWSKSGSEMAAAGRVGIRTPLGHRSRLMVANASALDCDSDQPEDLWRQR
jgi:hypothetical protein